MRQMSHSCLVRVFATACPPWRDESAIGETHLRENDSCLVRVSEKLAYVFLGTDFRPTENFFFFLVGRKSANFAPARSRKSSAG
jgi:hypothetical protein